MKKVAATILILLGGLEAYSQDKKSSPKPMAYQQVFDKSLGKVNDDILVYSRLSCTASEVAFVLKTLKADVASFSTLFAKLPNDKEFIKNTEIGLGVNDFANLIIERQAKKCANNGDPQYPLYLEHPASPEHPL
jgi:hypothetical protein